MACFPLCGVYESHIPEVFELEATIGTHLFVGANGKDFRLGNYQFQDILLEHLLYLHKTKSTQNLRRWLFVLWFFLTSWTVFNEAFSKAEPNNSIDELTKEMVSRSVSLLIGSE